MDQKDKPAAGAAAASTAEQLTEAQARGFTEGKVDGTKAGAEAERARISAILTHAEATDRRGLAEHLAFKTGNTVEEAAALLAAAPKAAAAPTNILAATMDKVGNPKVAADAGEAPPKRIDAGKIYDARRLAAVK